MTRLAEMSDLPECCRMGQEFAAAAGVEGDADSIYTTLLQLIEADSLVVSGEPVNAMAAFLVYDNYFNRSQKAAQELFWWVDPAARRNGAGLALLRKLEELAAERGARTLTMVALDALDGDRVAEMYKANGYRPLERNFVKVL